jgi:hypothetical protein
MTTSLVCRPAAGLTDALHARAEACYAGGMQQRWLVLIGIVLGAAAGFAYYVLLGCDSG